MRYTKVQIARAIVEFILIHVLYATAIFIALWISNSDVYRATLYVCGYTLTVQAFVIYRIKEQEEKHEPHSAALLFIMLFFSIGILCIFLFILKTLGISSAYLSIANFAQVPYVFVLMLISHQFRLKN